MLDKGKGQTFVIADSLLKFIESSMLKTIRYATSYILDGKLLYRHCSEF